MSAYAPPPAWHELLAPLPSGVVVRRSPVVSPEVLAGPHGGAVAGWDNLTIELSAGAAGLRHVLVVLDAADRLIAAHDGVLYTREVKDRAGAAPDDVVLEYRHETLGGRFEADGSFQGTRWTVRGGERADGSETDNEAVDSKPTADEVAGLRALVDEMRRRAPARGEGR